MAWIEFHEGLRDHWKIHRLSAALKIDYPSALGHISLLWLWCVQNSPKGDVSRFTNDEICRAMSIKVGEKDMKITLSECGLVNASGRIHDWHKHGVSLMIANRKRVAEFRKKKRDGNITDTLPLHSTNLTKPNLTKPNHTKNTATDAACSEIIAYLNLKSCSKYSTTAPENLKFVRARLANYSPDDLRGVVDRKVAAWKGTEWEKFLRPETLFNATKFQGYVNEQDTKKKDDQWAKPFQG